MTIKEAAQLMGVSASCVKTMIQRRELKADPIVMAGSRRGFYYNVSPLEVQRYLQQPQPTRRGWPRGKKRK